MKLPNGTGILYWVLRKCAEAFRCLKSNMVFMSWAVSFPYGGTKSGISSRATLQAVRTHVVSDPRTYKPFRGCQIYGTDAIMYCQSMLNPTYNHRLTINSNVSIWEASSTMRRSTGTRWKIPQLSKAGLDSIATVDRMIVEPPSLRSATTRSEISSSDRIRRSSMPSYRCSCLYRQMLIC